MNQYVALLRGINVGGNNRVDMKQLKRLFEDLGYVNVRTYINSGNVVFAVEKEGKDRRQLSHVIEGAIEKRFGLAVKVVVTSARVITDLNSGVPDSWTHDSVEKRCEVLFLWSDIDSEDVLDLIYSTEVDELVYYPGAVVWRMNRKDYNKSGLHKLIGTEVYKKSTMRNINTVRKLADMLKEMD